MPVPTVITDLSTTAASNSPSGSENVFPSLDDYLRSLSAFMASIRDNSGNGWTSPYLPLTYSAGTANGVVYLNGSKVVTTGSGLVFDGTHLGIGTSSPGARLETVASGSAVYFSGGDSAGARRLQFNATTTTNTGDTQNINALGSTGVLAFSTNSTERARITSGGDLLVPSAGSGSTGRISVRKDTGVPLAVSNEGQTGTLIEFSGNGSGALGSITHGGSSVSYNTSSDYRLKDNPQPLTNSGAFIDALQPKTWEWKADGSKGVGFIAHEAQAVSPSSVVGTKDAVDADGKPVMQAMEYGSAEFIANIIAELQSLRARVAALEAA